MQSAETCSGTHGYHYALIKVEKKKRASHIQKMIEAYDRDVTPGMKIKLTKLPDDNPIVGFGHGHEFMNHIIYKEIERSFQEQCPSYVAWNVSRNQDESSSRSTSKLRRLLETSMVPSLLNPICTKQERAARLNPQNKTKNNECVPSDIQTQAVSHGGTEGSNAQLKDDNPLEYLADQYTSDPENDQESLARIVRDQGGTSAVDNCVSQQSEPSITQDLNLELSHVDEDSRDSVASLGTASSSSSLSQGTTKTTKALSRAVVKGLTPILKKLLGECEARDYLTANNIFKDDEIAAHKQKRDSQEGKTAVQTKKANRAIQREIKAREESVMAKSDARKEKQRREKAEAEKGSLLNTNASLSIVLANSSTGDQVCIVFNSTHVKPLTIPTQLENWLSKNGYVHLKEFVSHLISRGISPSSTSSGLKGVAPALPFSDRAFRRYYDHCLAYSDFKEASKSDNKHRLYLGLLGQSPYPEAVIYHYRERLLNQVDELCGILSKPPLTVDALLSPIQGDPFDLEEVFFIDSSIVHHY